MWTLVNFVELCCATNVPTRVGMASIRPSQAAELHVFFVSNIYV